MNSRRRKHQLDERSLVRSLIEERLTELETSIRYIWYRMSIGDSDGIRFVEIEEFFSRNAIGHPNAARLRKKIREDRRTLVSRDGKTVQLKAAVLTAMNAEFADIGRPERPSNKQASHLEQEAGRIVSAQTRSFVAEALNCANSGSPRAAILMSWIGAVALLQDYVFANKLKEFNTDATANGVLKRPATAIEDLRGISKESHFLDCLQRISVIDQAVKRGLKRCLDRRNDAGHPSEIKFSDAAVADHLETLILNVFQKF